MRRSLSLCSGVLAGAVMFAACRETAVAPSEPVAAPVILSVAPVTFNEIETQTAFGGIRFAVLIDPRRENVYSDGINTIRFPASSICDPSTSSYGPTEWDAPCAPATSPILLPVNLSFSEGRLLLHFGKNLRFVPSNDASRHVTLTSIVPAVSYTTEPLRRFAILWQPDGTTDLVDEAVADPSLVTVIDRANGRLLRRLKHFTGYSVHLGTKQCNPDIDPDCTRAEGTVRAQ